MVSMSPYLVNEVLFYIIGAYLLTGMFAILCIMQWVAGGSNMKYNLYVALLVSAGILVTLSTDVKIGAVFFIWGALAVAIIIQSVLLFDSVKHG